MISEVIDYIYNFDKKDISLAVLFTEGRSGSVLLQSLLDNHTEVISTLIPFSFFSNFDSSIFSSFKEDYIIDATFNYIKIHSLYDSYIYLGVDKNKSIDFYLEKSKKILKDIIFNLDFIDKKKFFLALVFSFAKAFEYDLSKIK